jgi:hypothetical protein
MLSADPAPLQLFRDGALENGFRLSATNSTSQPVEIATVFAARTDADPQWRLAQWGTRFNLVEAVETLGAEDARILANEGKEVRVYPGGVAGEGVYLAVHGGAEYDGKLRQRGEAWPHLLIEQSFPGGITLTVFQGLRLQLAFRIDKSTPATTEPLDPGLHTAHITAFFTIHNRNKESPDYRDMIWFGVPLFDARHDIPRGHQALDVGKDDATGKFICTIDGSRFWDKPTGDGGWHALDVDLLPLIREVLAASQGHGYLTASHIEDLAATSFNLGWEVPGPYDCAVHLKGLRLQGARKGTL